MWNTLYSIWLLLSVVPTAVATANERTCIKNTGQKCMRNSFCGDQLGPAYCKWNRCFCLDHACAGADDACHTGSSMEDVAGGQEYKIRSLNFNNLHLKAKTAGPIVAESMADAPSDEVAQFSWTLRKPPATDPRRPAYVVYNKEWPDAVMMMWTCSRSRDKMSNLTLDEQAALLENPNVTNAAMQDATGGSEVDAEAPASIPRNLAPACRPFAEAKYVQGSTNGIFADPDLEEMLSYLVKPPQVHQDANPEKQLVMIANYQSFFLCMGDSWTNGGYGKVSAGRSYAGYLGYRKDRVARGLWHFEPPLPTEVYDTFPSYSEVSVQISTTPALSPRSLIGLSVACLLLAVASF